MTTVQNVGSQRVLVKSGFEVTEGSPTHLNVNDTSLQTIHSIEESYPRRSPGVMVRTPDTQILPSSWYVVRER